MKHRKEEYCNEKIYKEHVYFEVVYYIFTERDIFSIKINKCMLFHSNEDLKKH